MTQGSASHTAIAQPSAVFPPFQKDTFPSQLTWLAVTFIVLYLLVAKIGLPRVTSILAARRRHIETLLAEADTCRIASRNNLAEYQRAIQQGRQQAEALVHDTQHRLATETKRTNRALEVELDAQIASAERSISTAKEVVLANLRPIVTEASELLVASISGASPAEGTASRAVDRVLRCGGEHDRG